jgi:hypothetical protein
MATVLLVMDGRAKDGSTQPELLPLAHAVSRGVTHTGAQVRLFGLSDSTESAAALASSDIKELPRDPDALQELCAGVEAVIIGGVYVGVVCRAPCCQRWRRLPLSLPHL